MMINEKPYFENVLHHGDLFLEHIILEYEYPILFICKGESNKKFLCLCNEVREVQEWILTQISIDLLKNMIEGKISVYDAFSKSGDNKIILKAYPNSSSLEICEVLFTNIDPLDLPNPSRYLKYREIFKLILQKLEQDEFNINLKLYKKRSTLYNIDVINSSLNITDNAPDTPISLYYSRKNKSIDTFVCNELYPSKNTSSRGFSFKVYLLQKNTSDLNSSCDNLDWRKLCEREQFSVY